MTLEKGVVGDLLQIKHPLYSCILYIQVALPLIALSAVGWLVYVVGFGLLNNE